MKINHNMSATLANSQLLKTENRLAESVRRLSSGLKINEAADDPAGMAISEKMRTQIRGLSRASDNAMDGISVIETAEGALTEMHSILQRARELSVQAANETYDLDDRKNIQSEINSLMEEVDRISRDTEFNKTHLLDGSMDQKGYTDSAGVKVTTYSTAVPVRQYQISVTTPASKATLAATLPGGAITAATAGSIVINGESVGLSVGDTPDEVYEKIRELGTTVGLDVNRNGSNITFQAKEAGASTDFTVNSSNANLLAAIGLASGTTVAGTDAVVALGSGFEKTATVKADGNHVVVTDLNGFSMTLKLDETQTVSNPVTIDILDVGNMGLQIGANEGQVMEVKIPRLDTDSLRLIYINVCSTKTASNAIGRLDEAINMVSNVRGQLGAYQNRLEHAVASLDTTEESLTQALSRIEDIDMALEMTEYTQSNVLQQAGVSVLAQANDLPESVLQLLS